jgi:protease-4
MTSASTSIFSDSTLSSRDIANTLYTLKDDSSVKAVLLDINSPGGSPVGSEEISIAIEELKKEKPVYALINDLGASGAYWIAASTDKIYASKMSIVGSIGVTSATLGFEDFIKDFNITYRRQSAGEFKDMGTPYRKPTQKEEEILQNILDDLHSNFIQHVANSRNMTYQEASTYSTGEIFLGTKALEYNLIDEIGHYPNAIDELINITNEPNTIVVNYGPQPGLFEGFGIKANNLFLPKENQILLK